MALERVQQSYDLPNGAHGTIYRSVPRRGRKSRVHCVIVPVDSAGNPQAVIDEPDGGFATWDEAETWMRKTTEAQNVSR